MSRQCNICGSYNTLLYYTNPAVSLLNNSLCASAAAAKNFPVGELVLYGCQQCGFSWNEKFSSNALAYDVAYENNQSHSACFTAHVDAVIDKIVHSGARNIVEIGCGQGYFLQRLQAKMGKALQQAIGFDPALREEVCSGSVILHKGLLDKNKFPSEFIPELAICRHTIEHIQDVQGFMQQIRQQLPEVQTLYFETPALEWILRQKAYFDLYHEHCSLFTAQSLGLLLGEHCQTEVEYTFGGQYLSAFARQPNISTLSTPSLKTQLAYTFEDFSVGFAAFVQQWQERLMQLHQRYHKLCLWGAASKGAVFLQLMQQCTRFIDCVVDNNPLKQGHYIPVSGIPIVSPAQALLPRVGQGVGACIVANPLYMHEIAKQCQELGCSPYLLPLE